MKQIMHYMDIISKRAKQMRHSQVCSIKIRDNYMYHSTSFFMILIMHKEGRV